MTLCSCGLSMRVKVKALVCDHCDSPRVHVIASCIRCIAIGVHKPAKP